MFDEGGSAKTVVESTCEGSCLVGVERQEVWSRVRVRESGCARLERDPPTEEGKET